MRTHTCLQGLIRARRASHPGLGGLARTAALCALAWGAVHAAAECRPDYLKGDYLFVLTSEYDYSAGSFSLVDMNSPWAHDNNCDPLHGDAIARSYGGLIYVVERWGGDNIRVLDPQDGFRTVRQFSVGPGSNPQDICFVSPYRAFVTRYESAELWEVDPATGQHTDTIDLSPLADADGLPEMHSMAIRGERLYVTIQRLDRDFNWTPTPPSYLAVIDLNSNTLLDRDPLTEGMQGIALAATCPNSGIVIDPLTKDFLIGETGLYDAFDGGIERLDPATERSDGLIVTEEQLGGNLNTWDTGDGWHGFAVVIAADWSTRIIACDLRDGANLGCVASSEEYAFTHLHVDISRHQLFVTDRTYANPGLRIFHTTTFAPLAEQPIPVGLYPFWLLDMHGSDSSAPEDGVQATGPRLELFPQPAAGPITFRLETERTEPVSLEIFDANGRRVSVLSTAPGQSGFQQAVWAGYDGSGRRVPAGAYLARLRTPAGTATGRIRILGWD